MIDVVIFEGNEAHSAVEEVLICARRAALQDNLAKLLSLPEVGRVFLSTNQPEIAALAGSEVHIEMNEAAPADFHFGRELLRLVQKHQMQAVLCLGGAALPLVQREELADACRRVLEKQGRYVTNNVQSADMVAFNPAEVLSRHELPATDNALVLLLRYDARFEQNLMPTTLGTQFDIDTPSDLLVLADSPFGGPHLRKALDEMQLDTTAVRRLKDVLKSNYPDVAMIGRIGAPAIARINHNFKVRLRIFSEERGMKALGRLDRNEVVSLLGFWLEEIGPDRFFSYLEQTVDAALIDTRVLFAHMKEPLSDADRFYSDLGDYEKVHNPFVREFTRAATQSKIPVLLGGHSLVTGCIWAFVEEIGCLI
ncbi:hypothetical protein [Dethiobacter alkaliphilus]|uniref:hypothetical protein n=1 Tax=Dethiobacter alkaliphilus TaxID=427926 RepID=UPI00222755EA|nr:hypothetical protein [Dethiobacter alkaliphilus]MCW3488641.1 hypothetical protein [Dethiobacter alkaliphilus]